MSLFIVKKAGCKGYKCALIILRVLARHDHRQFSEEPQHYTIVDSVAIQWSSHHSCITDMYCNLPSITQLHRNSIGQETRTSAHIIIIETGHEKNEIPVLCGLVLLSEHASVQLLPAL